MYCIYLYEIFLQVVVTQVYPYKQNRDVLSLLSKLKYRISPGME